jgi:hypothetical protein
LIFCSFYHQFAPPIKSGYLREKRIGGGVFFTLDEIVDFIGGAN